MTTSEPNRYTGKPMLMLLDSYVLDALGALDEKSTAMLAAQTSSFARILGVQADTWQGIVETSMEMPPDSRTSLQEIWEQNVHAMIAQGATPDPLAFTHSIVDARFGDAY